LKWQFRYPSALLVFVRFPPAAALGPHGFDRLGRSDHRTEARRCAASAGSLPTSKGCFACRRRLPIAIADRVVRGSIEFEPYFLRFTAMLGLKLESD
jgi:hypothetical protein